jgi:alcohol dehydrogenase
MPTPCSVASPGGYPSTPDVGDKKQLLKRWTMLLEDQPDNSEWAVLGRGSDVKPLHEPAATIQQGSEEASLNKLQSSCCATVFSGEKGSKPVWVSGLPMPKLVEPTDCLVKVLKTTICGTDLHIYNGLVESASQALLKNQEVDPNHALRTGHEGIAEVLEVGSAVSKLKVGDRVVVSCISHCDTCKFCNPNRKYYGNCEKTAGWVLGNEIDGMQGEYARVPLCDTSCHVIDKKYWNTPQEDALVLCSDILPTGLEVGLLDGLKCLAASQVPNTFAEDEPRVDYGLSRLRDLTVCFVGLGPVGLAALMSAVCVKEYAVCFKKAICVDLNEHRLKTAGEIITEGNRRLSNNITYVPTIPTSRDKIDDVVKEILSNTDGGAGVDLVVEAIGSPTGWRICQDIVKPGGHIAMLGVHGRTSTINLDRLWYKNFTFTAGMVHGYTTDMLIDKILNGEIPAEKLLSHRMRLSETVKAYDMFINAADHNTLKVLLVNDEHF